MADVGHCNPAAPFSSATARMDQSFRIKVGDDVDVSFSSVDIAYVIDASMVYPRRSSMIDKEIKLAREVLTLSYKCDKDKCNFDSALQEIKNEPELKALGVMDITAATVSTVASRPDLFPARGLDGFVLQTTGKPFLYLENTTLDTQDRATSRTGFMDLTEMRKRLFFKHEAQSRGSLPMLYAFVAGVVGSSVFWLLRRGPK